MGDSDLLVLLFLIKLKNYVAAKKASAGEISVCLLLETSLLKVTRKGLTGWDIITSFSGIKSYQICVQKLTNAGLFDLLSFLQNGL